MREEQEKEQEKEQEEGEEDAMPSRHMRLCRERNGRRSRLVTAPGRLLCTCRLLQRIAFHFNAFNIPL